MNNNRLDEGKYLKPNPDKIEALIMKDNNLGLFLRESYFPPKEQVYSLGEMMDQAFFLVPCVELVAKELSSALNVMSAMPIP